MISGFCHTCSGEKECIIRRRSQEYSIDVQQNLETLNHDLPVASWDLTIPWSGTPEAVISQRTCAQG